MNEQEIEEAKANVAYSTMTTVRKENRFDLSDEDVENAVRAFVGAPKDAEVRASISSGGMFKGVDVVWTDISSCKVDKSEGATNDRG